MPRLLSLPSTSTSPGRDERAAAKRTSVKKPHAHQSVGLFFLQRRKVLILRPSHHLRQLGDVRRNAPGFNRPVALPDAIERGAFWRKSRG
jgi:hypothetical protein